VPPESGSGRPPGEAGAGNGLALVIGGGAAAAGAAAQPGMHAARGGKQRRLAMGAEVREVGLGLLHHAFLIEVGKHQPLVLIEGVARGIDDGAAVNPAKAGVGMQPEPFEHGGDVPGVDQHPVDGGLAAHRVEPGPIEEGRSQGVAGQRLVEPGDRRRRRGEGAGERGLRSLREQRVEHLPSSRFGAPGMLAGGGTGLSNSPKNQ
jgi:hypothetical protein